MGFAPWWHLRRSLEGSRDGKVKRPAAGWAAPLEQAYVERIFHAGGEQETQRGRRRFGLFAGRAEQAGERVVSGGGDLQAPYLARVDARFPVQHRAEDAARQRVFGGRITHDRFPEAR